MLGLQLVVAIGLAVVVGTLAARRTGVAVPVALLVAGLGLSLIPAFGDIGLPSEVVLLLFLPPLLYWESLTTSSREIRRFIRGIALTSTVLVVVTAGVIAVVGYTFGLAWPAAWILGAALAPTDATAVAALGPSLPRGPMTILRAESLINDGTTLVIFALAVEFADGRHDVTPGHAIGLVLLSFGGGIAVGAFAGWLAIQTRRQIADPLLANVVAVLTPFATYLVAEEVHASGVLAVVVCGLVSAHLAPSAISAAVRSQQTPFWSLTTFLLNGALLVLIGIQLPGALGGLSGGQIATGAALTVTVFAATLATRLLFLNASIFLIRALDRRPKQRSLRTTFRGRVVSMVAGFRGCRVAHARPRRACLRVRRRRLLGTGHDRVRRRRCRHRVARRPRSATSEGHPLGPPAAGSVRGRRVPDRHHDRHPRGHRGAPTTRRHRRCATRRPGRRAPRVPSASQRVDSTALRRRGQCRGRSETLQYQKLKTAALAHKRATVVRLRNEQVIDDTVLRRIQAQLDLEELRLSGPVDVE